MDAETLIRGISEAAVADTVDMYDIRPLAAGVLRQAAHDRAMVWLRSEHGLVWARAAGRKQRNMVGNYTSEALP